MAQRVGSHTGDRLQRDVRASGLSSGPGRVEPAGGVRGPDDQSLGEGDVVALFALRSFTVTNGWPNRVRARDRGHEADLPSKRLWGLAAARDARRYLPYAHRVGILCEGLRSGFYFWQQSA